MRGRARIRGDLTVDPRVEVDPRTSNRPRRQDVPRVRTGDGRPVCCTSLNCVLDVSCEPALMAGDGEVFKKIALRGWDNLGLYICTLARAFQ